MKYVIFSLILDFKKVFLVRNDLKMTKGKACAQCGHATLGAYQYVKYNISN